MSRKKISTTIYVTPEQSERLRLLHERTKVPVAVYIREGIDLVLRQYGHLLPGQLPLERQADAPPAHGQQALPTESKPSVLRQERAERTGASTADNAAPERAAGSAGSKG
jgi:Ribbon-helix-helix domain